MKWSVGDKVAVWSLSLWLAGMPLTFGYWASQCPKDHKDYFSCVFACSFLWPVALPGNVSYRVFN